MRIKKLSIVFLIFIILFTFIFVNKIYASDEISTREAFFR